MMWAHFCGRLRPHLRFLLVCLVSILFSIGAQPAVAAVAAVAADTTVYTDAETGFTFSQYFAKYSLDNKGIYYRVAVPSGVAASAEFDVVVQIVAGVDVGWVGLAWGGGMIRNPLAAAWGSQRGGVISSRWADGHYMPRPNSNASYEVLRTGTRANATHWQVTAQCRGCTSWSSTGGGSTTQLNALGSTRLAFAYSPTRVASPSSNLSDFEGHSVIGFWSHDFTAGANAAFASLVAKNQQ